VVGDLLVLDAAEPMRRRGLIYTVAAVLCVADDVSAKRFPITREIPNVL
jgi:hypothetical protein